MADRVISFDLGMEILRGTEAALAMHARRTMLALAALPDPYTRETLEIAEDLLRLDACSEMDHATADHGFPTVNRADR
jgi:hypothetical protein